MTITQSPARLALARQAAALRDQGLTYDQIAARLSVSGHQVRRLIRDGLAQRLTSWMDRRFGVEIEHHGVAEYTAANVLRSAGLDAEAPGYTHRVTAAWKCITDSSCGYEAVSPILSGDNGFAQLASAMTALRSAGASVSTRCGMHVHLDMADLDGPAIARLVRLYAASQEAINGMMPPSRRNNGFCRSWDQGTLETVAERLALSRSISPNFYDRYRTINVCSFPKYGTIEVRQHQGTLNSTKAEAWIKLMMALVEIAKTDRCADVVTDQGTVAWLDSVCSIVDMPATTKARLVRRFDAAAIARQSALLSLAGVR